MAEYMGEILHHLEQSIIVTHDDTFREMAEKLLNYRKDNGLKENYDQKWKNN